MKSESHDKMVAGGGGHAATRSERRDQAGSPG